MKKYAVTLAPDGRITSITLAIFAPKKLIEGGTVVLMDDLPANNYNDYRVSAGAYVYDPLPAPPKPLETPTLEARVSAAEDALLELMMGGEFNV